MESLESLGEIYSNWRTGAGPCQNCPRRDADHVLAPHYAYSYPEAGITDADVVLVGQAPGGTDVDDKDHEQIDDGKRTWKNYAEAADTGAAKWGPDEFTIDYMASTDADGEYDAVGNYGKDSISSIVETFEEKKSDISLYLTQHTKCADIHGDDFDPARDRGINMCRRYLVPEVKFIDPDTIIAFSGQPCNHVQRTLADIGVSEPLPDSIKNTITDDEGHLRTYSSDIDGINATIFPTYQMGQGMGNITQHLKYETLNEYFNELVAQALAEAQ